MTVDDSYDWSPGISGGERKRLSLATELLSNPDIIFADEPTSGLDSYMAHAVCKILQSLSQEGKLVICVIHQPSSEIFELFSDLLLLAKGRPTFYRYRLRPLCRPSNHILTLCTNVSTGRTAYLGPRAEAVSYFSSIGYNCPKFYNPADFLIEELAVTASNYSSSISKLQRITDSYYNSGLGAANSAWMSDVLQHKNNYFVTKSYPASSWTQLVEQYKRSLKSYAR